MPNQQASEEEDDEEDRVHREGREQIKLRRVGKSKIECKLSYFSDKDQYEVDFFTPPSAETPYGTRSMIGI